MADDNSTTRDWRDTVFLPKTDFPMKAGLAAKEPQILARWQRIGLYDRLRERRKGEPRFILHDGPPYANGDIHMGHAMNKVLKDLVVRTRSLMGYDAPYVPGWDCHGLPIEWKIEEQYRKKKLNKDEVPPAEFRAECRAYAAEWVGVQRAQFERLGVMGDWDDPYLTMKYEAEATIAAELLKFAESGQLYRGAKPVMWSPVEKTALAEAEVEYEDIVSTQVDVAFEIVEAPNAPGLIGRKAVIWTTTPWTIPVNQAIAFNPDADYLVLNCVRVLGDDTDLIVAKDLVPALCARAGLPLPFELGGESLDTRFENLGDKPSTIIDPAFVIGALDPAAYDRDNLTFKGRVFEGASARHPIYNFLRHPRVGEDPASSFSAEAGEKLDPRLREDDVRGATEFEPRSTHAEREKALAFFARPRPFLPGDFVTTDQGTGLVHMAPDHGEDDFDLCKANGLDPVFAVEGDGRYRADWGWLGGEGSVINPKFNAPDGPICADLRAAGALLAASADYKHSYPHSWRSKAKLIFRATPQWFIPMDAPVPPLPLAGGGEINATLREIAVDAIAATRWIPARAENRINAMVAGRPDWVISRQRAWGVPIALYVNRATGDYLRDPAVNGRILAAFREGGADAWYAADHQQLLGNDHALADYEPVQDILDVWFDSGCTHVFTIEARYGADARADLYLEGSDQHRGWFQSSLLESCGTRGRAPYDAVLTHGFALDGNGRKMSKSQGNVVDPLKIMADSGADILRLWAAATDYFDDVKIGKDALSGASDAYRKLRNTYRYLLGALDGFTAAERVAHADMPELERYVLHRLHILDGELRAATEGFEFNRYVRELSDFANEELSAFFFDIRKDSLYCDAADSSKRRAYRTVLDILFEALVRYAAPLIPFTAEEVWLTRYPSEDGSVHFQTWPEIDDAWMNGELGARWHDVRALREQVTEAIEPMRREKIVRSSLEASVTVPDAPLPADQLAELFISAHVQTGGEIAVKRTEDQKCGRCWRHLPEVHEDGTLCARCTEVVA